MRIKVFVIGIFIVNYSIACCQIDSTLSAIEFENHSEIFIDTLNKQNSKQAQRHIQKQRNKGYLDCRLDSISQHKNKLQLHYTDGEQYYWGKINISTQNYILANNPKGTFSIKQLNQLHNKILNEYNNNGYPQAKIVQKADFLGTTIDLKIQIQKGDYIVYDSIKLDSGINTSYAYITHLTGLKKDKPFQVKTISSLQSTINNSNVFEYKGHTIRLENNKAQVQLELNEKKTNSFSGFAGFQPDNEAKMIITGQVLLHLKNIFKQGEKIDFEWKKTNPLSQYLDVQFGLPFLFKSPVGIKTGINLDKQDSTFTNTKFNAGLSFYLFNFGFLDANWQYMKALYNNNQKETTSNTISKLYGLTYNTSKLNNSLNPTSGYNIKLGTYLGNREIQYDNSNSNKLLRYDYQTEINVYIPIGKNTIRLKNQFSGITSDSLKQHELIRIGGNKTIRGFNENSIFSQALNISSIEYRFILDEYSSIYAFCDAGITNDMEINILHKNTRFAIGIGTNIMTRAGILSLSYAVGKFNSDPFLMNEGKIHIGYVNQF